MFSTSAGHPLYRFIRVLSRIRVRKIHSSRRIDDVLGKPLQLAGAHNMIVMKFGGTSVGTGERIANVGRITKQVSDRVGMPPVVVVSAMSGVTNNLVRAATTAASGDADTFRAIRSELQQKHELAIAECVTDAEGAQVVRGQLTTLLTWFENLCQSIYTLGELTPRGLDAVSGLGERISARPPRCVARGWPLRRWRPLSY
jgi:aspartokinase